MKTDYECIIVGGGPAGLAAAIALARRGITDILLVERGPRLGGILTQCIHPGFGLLRYREDLTGPEYALALEKEFRACGIPCLTGATVLGISESRILRVLSPTEGALELRARAIIVATGCRERTRENLEIPGTRPAGCFTAGQAQNLINLGGFRIGTRVIIQGSGDIGLIMARRLSIEGYEVLGVYERLPWLSGLIRNKIQCLDHFGIPLRFGHQICRIEGKRRVEGVWIERVDASQHPVPGSAEYHACDTVLFSVGLIPEVDILKPARFVPSVPGQGLVVDSHFQLGHSGIFLCGNALHIHDLADNASKEGEAVAGHVALFLASNQAFEAGRSAALPYRPVEPDRRFDAQWFSTLDAQPEARVCIVCPRGCILTGSTAPCPRGDAYYKEALRGGSQVLTTTISAAALPALDGSFWIPALQIEGEKPSLPSVPGAENLDSGAQPPAAVQSVSATTSGSATIGSTAPGSERIAVRSRNPVAVGHMASLRQTLRAGSGAESARGAERELPA